MDVNLKEYVYRLDHYLWFSAKAHLHFIIAASLFLDATYNFTCMRSCAHYAAAFWPLTLFFGIFVLGVLCFDLSPSNLTQKKAALLAWLNNPAQNSALSQKLLDLSDVLKASNAANTSENILNVTKRSRKSDESQESKNEDYEAIASLLNETPDNLTTMSAAHVKLTQSTPFSNSVHTEGHFKTLQFDIATAAEYLELTASKYDSFHEGATNEQLDGRDSREAMSIGCQFREEGIKLQRQSKRLAPMNETKMPKEAECSFTRDEISKSSRLKRPRLIISDIQRTLFDSTTAKKSRADDSPYKSPATSALNSPSILQSPSSVRTLKYDPYDAIIAECLAIGSEKRLNGSDSSANLDATIERICIEAARKRVLAALDAPATQQPFTAIGAQQPFASSAQQPFASTFGMAAAAAPTIAPTGAAFNPAAAASIEVERSVCIAQIARLAEAVKRLVRVAYKPGTVKELSSYAAAVVVHANVIASKTERILQRRLSHYQAQLLRTQIDELLEDLADTMREVIDVFNTPDASTQCVSRTSIKLAAKMSKSLHTIVAF